MRIRNIVIFILFVLIFSLGYYQFLYNKTPVLLYTGPIEKVTIGNIGEYSIFNLIAKENGYFKDNGLDAQIIEYPSGPPVVADLLSGKIDIGIAAEFVGVRNIFTNKDLRILSQVSKQEDFQLIIRKDAGIVNPIDLKGKRIGVTKKGTGEFSLGRFLSYNDIDKKDVDIIDMTPDEMIQAIEDGQIGAVVIFDSHAYKIQEEMGDKVDVWFIQRGRKFSALAYSTGTFVRNYPDVPERYLRSLVQAETYLNEHPEDSKAMLMKIMNYEDAYVRYFWPRFNFAIGLDQELLLAMEDEARFVIENKLTDEVKVPNYLDFIYFDILEKIKSEAISIIH